MSLIEGGCACADKNLKWAASRANFDDLIGLFQQASAVQESYFGEDGGVADLLRQYNGGTWQATVDGGSGND